MSQPKLKDFLEKNPGLKEKDYNDMYIGEYKGHHRKIKRLFNNNQLTKSNTRQVDSSLARLITT